MGKRYVLVLGGGDWYDASVDALIVPKDLDLKKEKEKHNRWYKEVYCPNICPSRYYSFPEWLIEKCNCRVANEIEEFYD